MAKNLFQSGTGIGQYKSGAGAMEVAKRIKSPGIQRRDTYFKTKRSCAKTEDPTLKRTHVCVQSNSSGQALGNSGGKGYEKRRGGRNKKSHIAK